MTHGVALLATLGLICKFANISVETFTPQEIEWEIREAEIGPHESTEVEERETEEEEFEVWQRKQQEEEELNESEKVFNILG